MKLSSGKDIKCFTFSVLELHTIELKFSDRGRRAITPFGRNRCQATWLSVPYKKLKLKKFILTENQDLVMPLHNF